MKGKITPLVQTAYGFETDKTSGSQYRNMDRARDLKKDTAFIYRKGENGLPYNHPVIQQAINAIWFNDGRRSEGVLFTNEFYPLPYEAIALVLAAVRSFHAIYPKQILNPCSQRSSAVSTSGVEALGSKFPSLTNTIKKPTWNTSPH